MESVSSPLESGEAGKLVIYAPDGAVSAFSFLDDVYAHDEVLSPVTT